MQSFTRSILGLGRIPSVGSALPPRWWPPGHVRQDSPLMALGSAYPIKHLDRLSRPWSMEKMPSKPLSCTPFTSATTGCIDTENMRQTVTNEVINQNPYTVGGIWIQRILPNSSHRDGAIYKNRRMKEYFPCADLPDRNEMAFPAEKPEAETDKILKSWLARLEPMMLSKATKSCLLNVGNCMHFPQHMLQFFSLTLAECLISNGPIELYGYISVRDDRDWMLNYIFNLSRDDPIIVKQGSLIEMTGPKRAIDMVCPVLVEYDMRIKSGEQEDDDLQLIDGAFKCEHYRPFKPLKHRINGNCGTVDMCLAYVEHAVEATIEVFISELNGGFSLSLSSFIYTMEDYEEIQLFHGTVDQSRGFRRFVVAVPWDTVMLLKFKLTNNNVERCCSFKANNHGCSRQKIWLELASASVKVTWSTI